MKFYCLALYLADMFLLEGFEINLEVVPTLLYQLPTFQNQLKQQQRKWWPKAWQDTALAHQTLGTLKDRLQGDSGGRVKVLLANLRVSFLQPRGNDAGIRSDKRDRGPIETRLIKAKNWPFKPTIKPMVGREGPPWALCHGHIISWVTTHVERHYTVKIQLQNGKIVAKMCGRACTQFRNPKMEGIPSTGYGRPLDV